MQSLISHKASSIFRARSTSLSDSAGVGSEQRFAAKQPSPTKHILLMTATITPHNARNLARTDPVARLQDYDEALGFYLGLIDRPLHGIVFVENSDSDVTTLRQLVASRGLSGRVEFLCNYGVHLYSEKGRAHGEFKLLDYAMTASIMVIEAGVNHVVWKITGPIYGEESGLDDRQCPARLRRVRGHEGPPQALDGHAPDGLDFNRIRPHFSRGCR